MECKVPEVISQVPGTELSKLAIVVMINVKIASLFTIISQVDMQRHRLIRWPPRKEIQ